MLSWPVIPPDAIARVWVAVHNLLDHTVAGGAFGRLGLGENVIPRRESHDLSFPPRSFS
jgi:hypothetical protein